MMMDDLPVVSWDPTRPSDSNGKMDMAVDKLSAMLGQESARYGPCMDYLSFRMEDPSFPSAERVNEGWRRRICEWSFEVVDHFGFDREAVSVALSYIDRVISQTTKDTGKPVPRRQFQLVAVTSLFLALKLHGETGADVKESGRRKLKIDAFVELSRGLFQVDTLETMERCIMASLDWHLNPPTNVSYLTTALDLFPEAPKDKYNEMFPEDAACKIFETARYLTELSVCVSKFAFLFKSSLVSYSAILCALEALEDSMKIPQDICQEFLDNLAYCIQLTPTNGDVRHCCSMIKEICPAMFGVPPPMGGIVRSNSVSSTASNDITLGASGKESPVSVIDPPTRHRKRSRKDEI